MDKISPKKLDTFKKGWYENCHTILYYTILYYTKSHTILEVRRTEKMDNVFMEEQIKKQEKS